MRLTLSMDPGIKILEMSSILDQGHGIRNSNKDTETKNMRPGFGFLVQNVCVFRGEEKGPENPEDPRAEEYMLGYYCRGLELTLVAICPPSEGRGKPIILDLASANLRIRRDRIINIRRLINLSTLLKPLSDLVQSASGEFQPMERNFSTVEITGLKVLDSSFCIIASVGLDNAGGRYRIDATLTCSQHRSHHTR
ncbi:hypothetical protein K439DRAFT_1632090 [Ramaria rubella]|nr:hypothetical protein K439DRAFT_1632090 [Ramaria rubella]